MECPECGSRINTAITFDKEGHRRQWMFCTNPDCNWEDDIELTKKSKKEDKNEKRKI